MATNKRANLPNRRAMLRTLFGGWLTAQGVGTARSQPAAHPRRASAFSLENVQRRAEQLAAQPYEPARQVAPELQQLTYDQYRLIAFRHECAIWRDEKLPFWLELHHAGLFFKEPMKIVLVEDGKAQPLPFDPGLFQYRGELADWKTSPEWDFAGFRLLCHLPNRPNFQEFCSFLGASYFRAVCTDQVYGTSARGLAVDMGLPRPEEFPRFRTCWIERPDPASNSIRMWALMDSPSVTGAYEIVIMPGLSQTTLDIDCHLYARRNIEKLGLAPMSSMWIWGEGTQPANDPRPEVHDADGLLVAGDYGEWLWRPLARRVQPTVTRFEAEQHRGFGLLQRDQDYDHYRDNEALYHRRPSVWVTPQRPFGPGAVELLELPTQDETGDNIALCWVPRATIRAGDTLSLNYRVAFLSGDPTEHGGGKFRSTVVDAAPETVRFRLTVDSPVMQALASDTSVRPVVTATAGRVQDAQCTKLSDGTWQLAFELVRAGAQRCELRAYVQDQDHILSETWSYLCT